MRIDYSSIAALSSEIGCNVTDLIALSAQNDPFYTGMPSRRQAGQWFADLWEHFGRQPGMHLRRAHYVVISQDPMVLKPNGEPYVNTLNDWKYLGLASLAARYDHLIPDSALVDRRNPQPLIHASAPYRYAAENTVRRMQRRWAELQPHLDRMETVVRAAMPMAKALESLRQAIDAQARGLSRFLYREFTKNSGNLELIEDTGLKDEKGATVWHKYSLGVVRGSGLFGNFVPYQELLSHLDTIADMRNSLPAWTAGDDDPLAEAEIVARAKEANLLPEHIVRTLDNVSLARRFLYRDNLALIERWGKNTGSPFKSLVCGIQEGDRLVIRSFTFEGAHFANPVLPDGIDEEFPIVPASIIELQREAVKYRWPQSIS